MTVLQTLALGVVASTALVAQSTAPAPRIEHGRMIVRAGTIAEAVSGAAPGDDATWVVWRVPMIDGQATLCSTWTTDGETVRGELLAPRPSGDGRPQVSPPTGPISLEAGTQLVVLARVVNRQVERLRSLSDDCPIDANDRTVAWLPGAGAADSLRFLTALAEPATLTGETRRIAQSAIAALAWHKDAAATPLLVRWLGQADSALRLAAARALAAYRGAAGAAAVIAAAGKETDVAARQQLVQAIGRSSDPTAVVALLHTARQDASPVVRGEAVTAYTRLAGSPAIPQVLAIANSDASADVQRRALSAISRLPQSAGVPALLTLARSTPTLKKEAVRALSTSDDPRARAYLESLLAP